MSMVGDARQPVIDADIPLLESPEALQGGAKGLREGVLGSSRVSQAGQEHAAIQRTCIGVIELSESLGVARASPLDEPVLPLEPLTVLELHVLA